MKLQEAIAKYGLPAILMIVLGLIGIAMYFGFKDKPQYKTVGLAVALTGFFIGLATIGYTWSQEKKTATPPPTNALNGGGGNGEDQLPGGM